MRCYLVTATFHGEEKTEVHRAYAGTNALARQQREHFMAKFGIKKNMVEIENAEVPLAKADLLEHLNRLLNGEVIAMPAVSKKPAAPAPAPATKEKSDAKPAKATAAKKPAAKKPAAKKPAAKKPAK